MLSGGTMLEAPSGAPFAFIGPFMHPGSGDLDQSAVEVPLPSAGTVSNVRFYVFETQPGWSFVFGLYRTGANVMDCTVSFPDKSCSPGGSASFAAGDKISVSVVSGTAHARVSWVATLH